MFSVKISSATDKAQH